MKRILYTAVILLFVLTGCGSKDVTVTDREGNEVVVGTNLERIISTAPSNTEVLIGLGLADKIVAVDNYSPTEELNSDVTILDFRSPDAEAIIGLEPDVIIASGHNKSGVEDPFAVLKEAGIPVVYIPSSESIEGIYGDIEFIASLTDTKEKGQEIIEETKAEIEKIVAISQTIEDKKSVYLEISPAPYIYTTGEGTFQNEMLLLIGANNIFGDETGWISASAETVVEKNPEVILTNVSYTEDAVGELLTREGFEAIDAVINEAVYLIDTNSSSRPSQHIIQAINEMAQAVYPEYYE